MEDYETCLLLQKAIAFGDVGNARECARRLARKKTNLTIFPIKLNQEIKEIHKELYEIRCNVHGPNETTTKAIMIKLNYFTQVSELKLKVPANCQFWIFNGSIASDNDNIGKFLENTDAFYDEIDLYVSGDNIKKIYERPQIPDENNEEARKNLENLANIFKQTGLGNVDLKTLMTTIMANKQNTDEKLPTPKTETAKKDDPKWKCTFCKTENLPLRPGCVNCDCERPQDYVIPKDYKPTEVEKKYLFE